MIILSCIVYSDSLRSDPDLPSLLLQFCKQVVDGLVCLAGKSFVHRDIAARNILLDKEHNCKVRGGGRRECSEVNVFILADKKCGQYHRTGEGEGVC